MLVLTVFVLMIILMQVDDVDSLEKAGIDPKQVCSCYILGFRIYDLGYWVLGV